MTRLLVAPVLLVAACAALAEQGQPVFQLWPDGVPGLQPPPIELSVVERGDPAHIRDRYAQGIADPDLVLFPAANPNGQALLIVPGGGYRRVVMDKEGYEVAEWFSKRGVNCYVLRYRLPGEGWENRSDVPLQDAQRALRIVRAQSAERGHDPRRVGVVGFSAGGHVAASLAAQFDREVYAASDDIDKVSARPDFAVLVYPVVSMDPAIAHTGSRAELLGPDPTEKQVRLHSVEFNVPPNAPPAFLLHAADDASVVVDNSLRLYEAYRTAGVPAELHIYSEGGHGFGLRRATDKPVFEWPNFVWRWLQALD